MVKDNAVRMKLKWGSALSEKMVRGKVKVLVLIACEVIKDAVFMHRLVVERISKSQSGCVLVWVRDERR